MAEAKKAGADVVCLPELFARPTSARRRTRALFDLAEPVPGPDARKRWAARRREAGVVVVASLFERRARGALPQHGRRLRRRRPTSSACIARCTSRTIPLYYEKFYFTPGDLGFRAFDTAVGQASARSSAGTSGIPEGARLTALQGADDPLLSRRRSAGIRARRPSTARAQHDAWRTIQRAHAIANGVYVAAVNRVGHESRPERRRSRVLGHRPSSPIRSDASSRRPPTDKEEILVADVRPRAASRKSAATGRSSATAASTPTGASSAGSSIERFARARGPPRLLCFGVPHARGVGAARGHLAHLASQPLRLAAASSPPSPGSTARSFAHLAPGEIVRILVPDASPETQARRLLSRVGVDLARVEFFRFPPTADGRATSAPSSCRTTRARGRHRSTSTSTPGPSTRTGRRTTACPRRAAARAAQATLRAGGARRRPVVLEGGSIDVNGRGTLLTTEECNLDPTCRCAIPGSVAKASSARCATHSARRR